MRMMADMGAMFGGSIARDELRSTPCDHREMYPIRRLYAAVRLIAAVVALASHVDL
jgi:hypothetical protein